MPNADLEQALTSQDPEELKRLYQQNKSLASKILENPHTSKKLILEIIQSEYGDYFDAWFAGSPMHVICSLSQKIPEVLLPPTAKKFWQRTQWKGLSEKTLLSLLASENLPEEFLTLISTHPNVEVRAEVAAYRQAPLKILRELAKEADSSIMLKLSKNPSSTEDILQSLLEGVGLHTSIAQHPNASESIKERLLEEGNREILKILASSPQSSEAILEKLFQRMIPEICALVLRNSSVPKSLLERAPKAITEGIEKKQASKNAWKREETIKKLQALFDELPDINVVALFNKGEVTNTLLEALVNCKTLSPELARLVAKCSLTSADQLRKLSHYPGEDVRKYIAANNNTPSDLAYRMAFDGSEEVRRAAVQNQYFPRELQDRVAIQGSYEVRLALVGQPRVQGQALCFLLGDEDLSIRQAAFIHEDLPEEAKSVLKALGVDKDLKKFATNAELSFLESVKWEKYGPWLRCAAVKQGAASEAFLSLFFGDDDMEVRRQVFGHPNMPVKTLVDLAKDPTSEILDRIKNASWPKYVEVLGYLKSAEVPQETTSSEAQEARSFTVEQAKALADHIDANVRQEVAKNPSTPPAVLEVLAYDFNRHVRHAVAGNLQTPDHILFALLRESDPELCRIAQMTIAQKVGDYSPHPGWVENAPLSGPKLLRVLRLSLSERTIKNIKDTIQRDPTSLRKRVSLALQRAKEKSTR